MGVHEHMRPLDLAMGHGLMEAVASVRDCGDPGRPLNLVAGHCHARNFRSVAFSSADVDVRSRPIVGVVRSLRALNRLIVGGVPRWRVVERADSCR